MVLGAPRDVLYPVCQEPCDIYRGDGLLGRGVQPRVARLALVNCPAKQWSQRDPLRRGIHPSRKALGFPVQKPLLRGAKVLLVAWGFSVLWFGGSRIRHRDAIPIWWVRAQGF